MLQRFKHVKWMDDSRLQANALIALILDMRSHGRRKKTWTNSVKDFIKKSVEVSKTGSY